MTRPALLAAEDPIAEPTVTDPRGEVLWFLGTVVRPKLTGQQTAGRLGMWEAVLPFGAAPPLHSHPQDETFYVLEGEVTVWLVEGEAADAPDWIATHGRRCGIGAAAYAPGGTPHTFRVESDTARMLIISTAAGIEEMIRAIAEPARWPWLQPPPDAPRVPPARLAAIERKYGIVRHGPPPPSIGP
jgi:mannose-6-phosphate isomerase-like protein (cupin superfamily)